MRRPLVAFPVFALLLLAPGCASVREPRRPEVPVEVPDAWSGTEVGAPGPSAAWWREFSDPALAAYVEEALEKNPRLPEAEARLRAALALARMAGAGLLPEVSAGEQVERANRYLGTGAMLPGSPATQRVDSYGLSLNLSWELDLWARVRSGEAAAGADARMQAALLDGAGLSLSVQTAKAYLAATEAALQLEVARSNLRSAEDLAGRIRERFASGLRQALDVRLAESEVAAARASVSLRDRARDGALRQLEWVAGRYPCGTATVGSELPSVPGPVQAGIPAGVLSRRPDLRAAEMRLAAASHRIQEAEASLYPRISLTGSGGLASTELRDILQGDFGVWSLGQSLLAPLFSGGRLRQNVDLKTAQEDEAAAAFAGLALTAFREVETALAAERYLVERASALRALEREALASLDLSEERYLAGLASILTVLEARGRHFSARSQLIRVRLEHLTTRIDLYAALGGGEDTPPVNGTGSEEKGT